MYKFEQIPKKIELQEYKKQENLFLDFLKSREEIISVYSIGEMELLGVSDLDYLIIFQDKIDKKDILEFTKKYNLIDTILFLDIKNKKDINYLSHHFNYNFVHGKDLKITFDRKNKNLNIIYAWKICFFSLLRNFYSYKYNQKIPVKNLLSQINDMRYPLYFLRNIGIEKNEYTVFLQEFSQYRKTYFDHQEYHKLEEFLSQSISISWDIISEISIFLKEKKKKYKNIWKVSYSIFTFLKKREL